jgi:hypothetical protein
MKKLTLTLLSLLVVGAIYFTSCKKSNEKLYNPQNETVSNSINNINYSSLANFNFPIGTTLIETNNKINFQVPSGYSIVGSLANGGFTPETNTGSVTCNCTSNTGGCSPALANGTYACVMTSCSSCKKSESVSESLNGTISTTVEDLVIFNDDKMAFFSTPSELNGRIMLPARFHNHPNVIQKLIELETNLMPSSNPNNKKLVFIDIFDYVLAIEVPSDIDNSSPWMSIIGSGSTTKCKCNAGGTQTCPLQSKLIAKWCDASNCSSCTLSGKVNNPLSGESKDFSIINNRIVIN